MCTWQLYLNFAPLFLQDKRVKNKELEMETKIIKSEEKLRQLKEIVYKVSLPDQAFLRLIYIELSSWREGIGKRATKNWKGPILI